MACSLSKADKVLNCNRRHCTSLMFSPCNTIISFFTYVTAIVVLIRDSIDQNSSGALHIGRYIINVFTERFIRA